MRDDNRSLVRMMEVCFWCCFLSPRQTTRKLSYIHDSIFSQNNKNNNKTFDSREKKIKILLLSHFLSFYFSRAKSFCLIAFLFPRRSEKHNNNNNDMKKKVNPRQFAFKVVCKEEKKEKKSEWEPCVCHL